MPTKNYDESLAVINKYDRHLHSKGKMEKSYTDSE